MMNLVKEHIPLFLLSLSLILLPWLLWHNFRWKIGPTPSGKRVLLDCLIQLQEFEPFKGEKIHSFTEMGGGFGTALWFWNKHIKPSKITIIEGSLPLFLWLKTLFFRKKHIAVIWKDLRKETVWSDINFCYLHRAIMEDLQRQWLEKGKESSKILITHTFALPQVQADLIKNAQDYLHTPIYFYFGSSIKKS